MSEQTAAAPNRHLTAGQKACLAVDVLSSVVLVNAVLRSRSLPSAVHALRRAPNHGRPRLAPARLGRIVYRVLNVGPLRTRCLIAAMVHYRLLRRQGYDAELVIGLPIDARSKDAHAWVEIDGRDVGPPPGRGAHEALVRYG